MLLEGKNAILYGAGGPIGGAVARAFAREGAAVHLTGRTAERLDRLAEAIRSAGGRAETACFDVFDGAGAAVRDHADAVAARAGSIDVSFSLVPMSVKQGTPLVEMAAADVERPVVDAVRALFLTARAAAPHMIRQGSGVILTFGGYGDPVPLVGGLQVAFGAVEALRRGLARELGPHGIRVLTLQTGGIAETISDDFEGRDAIVAGIEGRTMLGRGATLDDVANAAVFAASDLARSMTGTKLNLTCGSVVD